MKGILIGLFLGLAALCNVLAFGVVVYGSVVFGVGAGSFVFGGLFGGSAIALTSASYKFFTKPVF